MTREVPLNQGLVALVDDEDYERVITAGRWTATPNNRANLYAGRKRRRPDGRWTTIRLHTFLTGWPFVDHINGDGLDNRRANLRQATNAQNQFNKGLASNNTSGYKGVHFVRDKGKWGARIRFNGRQRHIGNYATPEEAARAYDEAAVELFGEFAWLNSAHSAAILGPTS